MVQAVPAGYHTVTPYLMVRDAARALAFYRKAFDAAEVMRFDDPKGRVAYAEIIGDSTSCWPRNHPTWDSWGRKRWAAQASA